ncbi:MAG: ABC transporter permease [Alistipes sp.]|nr:ABC transporter permease [Alistipes sp.]
MNKTKLIIVREFSERVRKKSFIITTLLMPLLMIGLMVAPSLMMMYGGGEQKQIVVIDRTGVVAENLTPTPEVQYIEHNDLSIQDACRIYGEQSGVFGILYIGSDIEARDSVTLISNSSSTPVIEESISKQLNEIVKRNKLAELGYDVDSLERVMQSVETNIDIRTRINNGTGDMEAMESSSSGINYALGMILGMLLYMVIILYGQMVLTSVVEEKSSRVIDVLVTSCTPFQIMMGKILGIALVALTQIAVWAVLIISASKFLIPALFSAEVAASNDMMMQALVGTLGDTGYIASLFAYLILFILGGFLLYASLYAAAGSAVDSVQDGQQFNTIIMMPIILSLIIMMSVFNDPNSPIAFWASIIPFTSPIVMIARIPFGIPTWEIIVSLVTLYLSFVVVAWVAAKIYRIGIFMHGKRPSWRELGRWLRM